MLGDRNHYTHRQPHVANRVIVDHGGRLSGIAVELKARLATLGEERLCAQELGLAVDIAYMDDLDLEISEMRLAYAGAAILQVAELRASLSGPNQG
jgi:hypothetical protein